MLGLPWIQAEDVQIKTAKGYLDIHSTRTQVKLQDPKHLQIDLKIRHYISSVIYRLISYARKKSSHPTIIFAVSLADIKKALKPKKRSDPKEKLPLYYYKFLDAFNRQRADQLPPHCPGVNHTIEILKDKHSWERELPWGPLYSISQEELIALHKTLTELLDKNFIYASHSPASAPVLFVKEPGRGIYFCVDYRKLNEITQKDRYPLPLITKTLRQLAQAKWFTKLNIIAAFNKIQIKEGDEWKGAFCTRYRLYKWLVTPFGFTGAPATFQRYINWTLQGYLDEFYTAYIDNVLIYSNGSLSDHRTKVKKVLKRL